MCKHVDFILHSAEEHQNPQKNKKTNATFFSAFKMQSNVIFVLAFWQVFSFCLYFVF